MRNILALRAYDIWLVRFHSAEFTKNFAPQSENTFRRIFVVVTIEHAIPESSLSSQIANTVANTIANTRTGRQKNNRFSSFANVDKISHYNPIYQVFCSNNTFITAIL